VLAAPLQKGSLDDFPRPDMLAESEYVVVDVETNGFEPSEGAEVLEVAALRFREGQPVATFASLVRPTRPVHPSASAVNSLTTEMLLAAPDAEHVMGLLDSFIGAHELVVAHNARFDRKFLPVLKAREWCCSYRFARHIWKEAPDFKNQTLRYWLKLDSRALRGVSAHRASDDCLVTGLLFQRELLAYQGIHPYATLDDVVAFVNSPLTVSRFMFGRKYYAANLEAIPTEYLEWVVGDAQKPEEFRWLRCDRETMIAVRSEMGKRVSL